MNNPVIFLGPGTENSVVNSKPKPDMTVAEVLEMWPETIAVFQKYKTACVGCDMAPFDTMEDVARIYELNLHEMLGALTEVIGQ